jgi:drug/metabolite transporter (DMT)-like permease
MAPVPATAPPPPISPRDGLLPGADAAGANLAVVVLGLASAVAFGSGDFGGGWTSRRAPVLGVSLVVQVVGLAAMTAAALLTREPLPEPGPAALASVGGVVGVVGIVCLYHGLAVGRMGVVAPVTGVLAALIPVTGGILIEGVPSELTLVGIALAIVAVVLVSRVSDASSGPSGLRFALVAGIGIGLFSVFVAQVSDGHAFGPLAIIRLVEAALIGVVVLVTGGAWRPERRFVPAMAGVGVLDMAGNGFFILAVQGGALAVAAVLSSLYPVMTVILATVFLRERVTRTHAVGIALAVGAIACIAAGTAS